MKKILFLSLFVVICLSAKSQIVVNEQAQVQSMEDLDARLKLGTIAFGDSIIHYLKDLNLISTQPGGVIKTKLSEYDLGFFRMGASRPPSSVFVGSKGYLINSIAAFYDDAEEKGIRDYLRKVYGKPSEVEGNTETWVGKKVLIMASRVKGVFCVGFTYLDV